MFYVINLKYSQAYIYCISNKEINSKILIENQVVYSDSYKLLLINEETLIIGKNLMNINVEKNKKSAHIKLFLYFVILLLLSKFLSHLLIKQN